MLPHWLKTTQDARGISVYTERLVVLLLGVFIFFNPFPHTTTIKEICLYLSFAIAIAHILFQKTRGSINSPLTTPFALYILWAFLSISWAVDRDNTIHDFYAHLLKYIAVYYLVLHYFASKKRLTLLAWIVVLSTSIFTIKGMVNFYLIMDHSFWERLRPGQGAPINTSAIVTLFSVFLSLLLFQREKHKILKALLSFCFTVTLLATILSYTRGVILALVVSTLVLLFFISKNRKTIIIFSLVIAVVVGTLYSISPRFQKRATMNYLMNEFRLGIYYTSFEIFKDYPIAGIGFGMKIFEKRMWQKYNPKVPQKWQRKKPAQTPHSFFFSILVRLGIIGLGIFGFLLVKTFQMSKVLLYHKEQEIRNWGVYLLIAFMGMLISGLFGSILHGPTAYNVYTVLAMITAVWQWTQNPEDQGFKKNASNMI